MAGLERFTVTFVIPPSKDFECSICLSVLREPYLTTCCGSHFCQLCVDNVKKKNNECPVCREKPVNAVIDKYFRRQLNQLQVYCPRRSVKGFQGTGCDWVGELGSVEEHLAVDQLKGECQYVEVECRLCGQPNLRRMLSKHINKSCPNRSISCQYCGFQSTHENITKQHIDVCPNFPLVCTNFCSSTMLKGHELPSHLSTCLEQEVACSFGEMGCKEKMQRKFLQQHLESNVMQHQMLTCQAFHV
ncbi:TNF receptor-associated factor 6-like [Dysidea avara]|uniref:TNF receptor-associated factor 6-like n=1 Tax=Dysidea avara TaxID=196820 RepID=UPI00332ADAB9